MPRAECAGPRTSRGAKHGVATPQNDGGPLRERVVSISSMAPTQAADLDGHVAVPGGA